jgi:hypothetical protein
MKAQNYDWFFFNESIDESNKEILEGYPVYPGSEDVYNWNHEIAPIKIYNFSMDNQILWVRELGVIH